MTKHEKLVQFLAGRPEGATTLELMFLAGPRVVDCAPHSTVTDARDWLRRTGDLRVIKHTQEGKLHRYRLLTPKQATFVGWAEDWLTGRDRLL